MFVFWKTWWALFSWNTRFKIRSFVLLPTYSRSCKHFRKVLKLFSEIYVVEPFDLFASSRAKHRSSHSEVFSKFAKINSKLLSRVRVLHMHALHLRENCPDMEFFMVRTRENVE